MRRVLILALAKVFARSISFSPMAQAAPTHLGTFFYVPDEPGGRPPDDPGLWLYLGVAVALVLLGGVFAGLTIALMGQVSDARSY